MGASATSGSSGVQGLALLPIRVLRLPFDVLFLTWDFLVVTFWGIGNLPAWLSGAPLRPFRACFEGGIIEERLDGTLWYCPLAPKYGTKAFLRLLFVRLTWHTSAEGRRHLCWRGSASAPPTAWGKYLLTGVVLALVWGAPTGGLVWRYRHSLPFVARLRGQPAQTRPAAPVASQRNPEMASRLVAQALELEHAGKADEARARFRDAVAQDPTHVEASLGVGRMCLELGLTDDARLAFSRALEADATSSQARLGLAQVLHAQGADRKALDLLAGLVDQAPTAAPARALQAACQMALGDLAAAGTAIEAALALAPDDEKAIATAADLQLRQGHLDKAETFYRMLVDRNVRNLVGRIGLARILRIKGNQREAESLLRALLVERPDEVQATEELIDTLVSADRPLDGLALCRETLDRNPGATRLREKYLGILFGLGRDNELYIAATKLLADSPGNLAAHTQLAAMFLRKGLPALAIDHCSKALAQQPGVENAYRLLITAQLQSGDVAAAKERLERLLAVLPQDLDSTIKLSECLRRQGDNAKAAEVLRQGIEYHPGSSIAHSQRAQVLFMIGDAPGALAEFREAQRLAPEDPKVLNNLAAVINYTDGDLAEALVYAEQARKREPYNPQILDTLAWVLARRGEPDKALPFSEMAVGLQPGVPILTYHYGAILEALGRHEQARETLKAALRSGADFHGAAEARALLERLSGAASGAPSAP